MPVARVTGRGDRQAKKPRAAKAAPAVAETAADPAAVETPPVETPPVETGAALESERVPASAAVASAGSASVGAFAAAAEGMTPAQSAAELANAAAPAVVASAGSASAALAAAIAGEAVVAAAPVPTSRVWHADGGRVLDDNDLLVVSGPQKGRWRAGRYFNQKPATIRVGDLADDELSAILADPTLALALVTIENGNG